jgi:coenzyme F420-reducing hydrogenase delta subunit
MIEEYVNKKLTQRNAANQHLLERLGVTMENLEEHEIAVNEEGEMVRVQRVMKATIWEKKQDDN